MALADILAAIKAQADKEIAVLQEQMQREKDAYKKKMDEEMRAFEEDLKKQTEAKKAQMKKKAETAVEMEKRKMLLEEKRKALDTVYHNVLKEVQKLPDEKKKKLEDKLKKHIAGRKGETKPAKEGGFTFVTTKSEEDFTFAHLVEHMLRPETELEVASRLFA